jgi:hypothetical protein
LTPCFCGSLSRTAAGTNAKQFWAGGKPYKYKLVRVKNPAERDTYGEPLAIGTRLEIDRETDTV